MRLFLLLLLTLFSLPAQAAWIVKSDFRLQLTEPLFDQVIGDFWETLQGKQTIPIGNLTVTPSGIPIQIEGIRTEVNYSFPLPRRIDGNAREWELASDQLSARVLVDRISASQVIVREVDGIILRIRLTAECKNIVLRLPQGTTSVRARIRAEVAQNQLHLSMRDYEAHWAPGAWQVESISCTGLEGFEKIVQAEALKALASFQNFDPEVRTKLEEQFVVWSREASQLLLTEREIPSEKDYVKIFYEPKSANENGKGLELRGQLRFEYPTVAPGQVMEQNFALGEHELNNTKANPELLVPFATIRALMMGEYFAGRLSYLMTSEEIPAFKDLMQSYWTKVFGWPDLMRFAPSAKFFFQFVPMGPPAFDNERAAAGNTVAGNMSLPLAVRMYAPIDGRNHPYVEFRTQLQGAAGLQLVENGKVNLQLSANALPVSYAWSTAYLQKYRPTQRIAADTMAEAVRKSLNAKGFTMAFPSLSIGKALKLVPQKWNLEGKDLRLDFTTGR